MKRWTIGVAAVAVAAFVAAATPAKATTSVDVHIQVGDPYRGVSLAFHSKPDVVLIPETRVYYVPDYAHDVYVYGPYWYFIEDGYWYRARNWRGPFIHIAVSSVPRAVYAVPVSYRRHWGHGPPPHAKAHGHDKHKKAKSDKGWKR